MVMCIIAYACLLFFDSISRLCLMSSAKCWILGNPLSLPRKEIQVWSCSLVYKVCCLLIKLTSDSLSYVFNDFIQLTQLSDTRRHNFVFCTCTLFWAMCGISQILLSQISHISFPCFWIIQRFTSIVIYDNFLLK